MTRAITLAILLMTCATAAQARPYFMGCYYFHVMAKCRPHYVRPHIFPQYSGIFVFNRGETK